MNFSRPLGKIRRELSERDLATNRVNRSQIAFSRICAVNDSYLDSPDGRHVAMVLQQYQSGRTGPPPRRGMIPNALQTQFPDCLACHRRCPGR